MVTILPAKGLERLRGWKHGSANRKAIGLELVVPAPSCSIRLHALGAILQHGGAVLRGRAVLLLVPAALGLHQRDPDRDRLFRDQRVIRAAPGSGSRHRGAANTRIGIFGGNTVAEINWTALIVFVALFGFITWLGFAAANWRKGDLDQLHEWGLGGRRFGTLITWFLVGGDIYTAYTFIAVPALAFGAGAIAFFAVPYTVMIYPILFLVFPRLWNVCHKHNYITPADFVRGRFGNRWLVLAVTITGIVAAMPYIALQRGGLQCVIGAMGVSGTGFAADLPLIIAFIILAAFTYSSGLRAPASIAIVKDLLIYITAFAAVIIIPIQLGGFAKIFAAVPP